MNFYNKNAKKVYKYIYIHDDETILQADIADETGLTRQTVSKYIKWLQKRNLITVTGKHFKINSME